MLKLKYIFSTYFRQDSFPKHGLVEFLPKNNNFGTELDPNPKFGLEKFGTLRGGKYFLFQIPKFWDLGFGI
jgi:hypothetical protein